MPSEGVIYLGVPFHAGTLRLGFFGFLADYMATSRQAVQWAGYGWLFSIMAPWWVVVPHLPGISEFVLKIFPLVNFDARC